VEALTALKAVFKANGTVTAGNSSQVSDGAAMTLLTSRQVCGVPWAQAIARLVKYAVVGVPPEIMGIGPRMRFRVLRQGGGFPSDQIDLIELNEAFAAQSLAVLRAIKFPEEKVNVNGGAIALGHPLGCTGTKLTVSLLNELKRRGGKYGIVSMCTGGGNGRGRLVRNAVTTYRFPRTLRNAGLSPRVPHFTNMNRRETGVCSPIDLYWQGAIMAVNKENPSDSIRPHLIALLAIFLLSLVIWSCNTSSQDDVYTVTFKLDSARVGKFDSVMVQIYNGKARGRRHQPSRADGSDQGDAHYQGSHRGAQFQGEEGFLRGDHRVQRRRYRLPEPAHRGRLRRRQHQAGRAPHFADRRGGSDPERGGDARTLPDFTPSNAGDKRFVLKSKDSTIAKVVQDSLKGMKAGKVKVIASTPDFGVSIDFTVNVANVRVAELKADLPVPEDRRQSATRVTVLPPTRPTMNTRSSPPTPRCYP